MCGQTPAFWWLQGIGMILKSSKKHPHGESILLDVILPTGLAIHLTVLSLASLGALLINAIKSPSLSATLLLLISLPGSSLTLLGIIQIVWSIWKSKAQATQYFMN